MSLAGGSTDGRFLVFTTLDQRRGERESAEERLHAIGM
jgi:hypothetical protein